METRAQSGEKRPLRIGVVCYPTQGGSGTVAVELAHQLADRGHDVHVVSYAIPPRLDTLRKGISFHSVHVPEYPLFEYPPYSLALAAQLAEVICRHHLDLIHVHYAMPHALSGWMARRIAARDDLPLITTLHGTDVTIVGNDPSYLQVTRLSVEVSDAVTSVSRWLEGRIAEVVGEPRTGRVIHNFVDSERFRPAKCELREHLKIPGDVPILLHVSNFRPVKRVEDVAKTFIKIREQMPARLLLVGDGPDKVKLDKMLSDAGLSGEVHSLGPRRDTERIYPVADLFLFPTNAESFGLAGLEAMACGVPVIGAEAGGLPEVVEEGVTGRLLPVGDTDAMAEAACELLRDKQRYKAMSLAARERAVQHFSPDGIVDQYEDLYWTAIEQVLKEGTSDATYRNSGPLPCDDIPSPPATDAL